MAATTPRRVALRERDRKALTLRAQGQQYDTIAAACGYPTPDAARQAVKRLLDRQDRESVAEARQLMIQRLETLLAGLWAAATGEAVDPKDHTAAVREASRLIDLLAKVEGTYAPTRSELSGPDGGPVPVAAVTFIPDEAWMREYVRAWRDLEQTYGDQLPPPAEPLR